MLCFIIPSQLRELSYLNILILTLLLQQLNPLFHPFQLISPLLLFGRPISLPLLPPITQALNSVLQFKVLLLHPCTHQSELQNHLLNILYPCILKHAPNLNHLIPNNPHNLLIPLYLLISNLHLLPKQLTQLFIFLLLLLVILNDLHFLQLCSLG